MQGEKMKTQKFILDIDEQGRVTFLGNTINNKAMNWVNGNKKWGTIYCPQGIKTIVNRKFLENGNLQECYELKNVTDFPMAFKRTDIGIYTTFNDNYEDTEVCLAQKCHTHIFCGEEGTYIMALQMGGRGPHLGFKMTYGSIVSYSVERDLKEESNDRGDFILHPDLPILQPGESVKIGWELFWFKDKEEFYQKLLEDSDFPVIRTKQCTYFLGEKIQFQIEVGKELKSSEVQISCRGENIPFTIEWNGSVSKIHCQYSVERTGEIRVDLKIGNRRTHASFFGCLKLSDLVEKRCYFIAEKQQYHKEGSHLDGAYLIYDNEEEKMYYSHLDDHNGGRERIGMGVLMASRLQQKYDKKLMDSLKNYIDYIYRELYDQETGIVYNDIQHNLDWHRLYNYPWMAVFQLELYQLFKEKSYLKDAYRTMQRYYKEGGRQFYGILIPAVELLQSMQAENMETEEKAFRANFIAHAEQILKNGIYYPPFEVRYEQSIVAPAVSCLLQAYDITKNEKFLKEAEKQLKILSLFNGEQPNYNQFEVAIRHWDGRWFGKHRRYGDTYPHYWSGLTGIDYAHYAKIKQNEYYKEKARASFRGCLNLFAEDGRASCAMVYPETVNNQTGHYYDPWANDQDWALYFALKYKEIN